MKHTTTSPTPIRSEEPKRQTTKEVIAANIKSLIEQLEGKRPGRAALTKLEQVVETLS
jgi:hypothetical protein